MIRKLIKQCSLDDSSSTFLSVEKSSKTLLGRNTRPKQQQRGQCETRTVPTRHIEGENGNSERITRALRHDRDLFEVDTATKKKMKMRQLSGSSTREEAAEHQKSRNYKHVPKLKCKCEGHCPPRA